MKAINLKLSNYRNYIEQEIDFCDDVNIIFGDNAQGKTNILEAVYFFAMGKSNRARRDIELINHNAESAKIRLEFSDKMRTNELEAELFRDKRKKITANDIPVRKNSELVRRFNVVYFGPEYLGLVKEGPSVRRKNLDILISQIKPGYISALGELKKIVESKNALLRMEQPNATMLEIMNDKLAAVSANIMIYRSAYLERIKAAAKEIQADISGGKEELEIRYDSCIGDVRGIGVKEIEKIFRQKLDEIQKREIRYAESVVGPHRDDIIYLINEKEAKSYGSQGQQKTIVMAQKLAEVSVIASEIGEKPVLLLDDILSELDRSRREYIINTISDMQILITCTDTDGIEIPTETRKIFVENGSARVI